MEWVRSGAVNTGNVSIMKKLFCLCAALAAVTAAHAAEALYFRSGMILRAETSQIKPYGFKNLSDAEKPEKPLYAAITVKLDEGRKISIFDYSLRIGKRRYKCAAVRDNTSKTLAVTCDGGKKRRCTLFFELDTAAVKNGGTAKLVCNAPDGGETVLKLIARGDRRFTPDASIPDPAPSGK